MVRRCLAQRVDRSAGKALEHLRLSAQRSIEEAAMRRVFALMIVTSALVLPALASDPPAGPVAPIEMVAAPSVEPAICTDSKAASAEGQLALQLPEPAPLASCTFAMCRRACFNFCRSIGCGAICVDPVACECGCEC